MGNTFSMSNAAGIVVPMTLTAARAWIRNFAKDAGTSDQYTDANIDRALITVGEQFCRVTMAVKVKSEVTVTEDETEVEFASIEGFKAERILRVYADGVADALQVVDIEYLNRMAVDHDGTTGEPVLLAFETPSTTAQVYPTPDDEYTLKVLWWQAFTSFTPGTEDDADIELNIPPDMLPTILTYGAPAVLQHPEPELRYASAAWQTYLAFELRMKGAGGLGARSVNRRMAE